MAERALRGVGDAELGEWRERGPEAVHLRRRLAAAERTLAAGLGVRDIRGTDEQRERIGALLRDAPHLRGLIA